MGQQWAHSLMINDHGAAVASACVGADDDDDDEPSDRQVMN